MSATCWPMTDWVVASQTAATRQAERIPSTASRPLVPRGVTTGVRVPESSPRWRRIAFRRVIARAAPHGRTLAASHRPAPTRTGSATTAGPEPGIAWDGHDYRRRLEVMGILVGVREVDDAQVREAQAPDDVRSLDLSRCISLRNRFTPAHQ